MFKFNHELHDIETRNHDRLHLYPTVVLVMFKPSYTAITPHPTIFEYLIDRIETRFIYSISHPIKCYLNDLYSCESIVMFVRTTENDKSLRRRFFYSDCSVIIGCICSSVVVLSASAYGGLRVADVTAMRELFSHGNQYRLACSLFITCVIFSGSLLGVRVPIYILILYRS